MAKKALLDKFAAIGINPPADEDDAQLEQTYRETVRNLLQQHRDLHGAVTDPFADMTDEQRAALEAQRDSHRERLDAVTTDDMDAAHQMIAEAGQYETLTISPGQELEDTTFGEGA